MTLVRYTGHAGTLSDYLDLGTGKTLTAEPGGIYDVTPASGRTVPDVPGNSVPLEGDELADEAEARAAQSEAEQAAAEDEHAEQNGSEESAGWHQPDAENGDETGPEPSAEATE